MPPTSTAQPVPAQQQGQADPAPRGGTKHDPAPPIPAHHKGSLPCPGKQDLCTAHETLVSHQREMQQDFHKTWLMDDGS